MCATSLPLVIFVDCLIMVTHSSKTFKLYLLFLYVVVADESLYFSYRFLQGPETDRGTVKKIRDAIDNRTEVTVQLINYTKSGT